LADIENDQVAQEGEKAESQGPTLTPLEYPEGYIPGRYAAFPISPFPIYGPDELGEYKSGIDDMDEVVTRADASARLWEVLQAWEARNMARGYQFNNCGRNGWNMYGAVNGSQASAQEIMQSHQSGRLFPVNVYGARQDKSSSVLAMDVPGLTFVPKLDSDPVDQTAADEKKKYLKVWLNDAGGKKLVRKIADLFYTDDRVVLWTNSWANQQEWGTETPNKKQEVFDAPEPDGITPENEQNAPADDEEVPAIREVTKAGGKLEWKVPIMADEQGQMGWMRCSMENNVNDARERWVWIEDKIVPGSKQGGDQIDRNARVNVRLAVQNTTSSGESSQQDCTETYTWYRPSQYRSIKKKEIRDLYFKTFPDGVVTFHAAGQLAGCRNEAMDKHLKVLHAKEGSGQNRRAIGTNYLPLQKILNANFGLLDRYFRACVPRKFHDTEAINSEAIAEQNNDPAKSTPVLLKTNQKIDDITGVERVPTPTSGIFEFIQWLILGAPEVMDGMEPSMFGAATSDADQGVYQTAKLKRDAARGVYSLPWSEICIGLAKAAEQASECAAANRVADISANLPGQDKLKIELEKMQGDALCYPESLEIPQTISEQEAQMAELLENGKNVAIYQAIANDPRNLVEFGKFPSLANLEIPGLDAVEQQQGEFELLLQSGPLPNPEIAQLTQQIGAITLQLQQGQTHPEAQTPQGQQAMQQLQQTLQQMQQQLQQIQQTAPTVANVPVAQDGSENHAIHAQITLGFMTSAAGRKLKYGNDEQKAVFQNVTLHWQAHVEMGQKLTPPQQMEFKGNLSIDPSKFSPEVQAKVFQAAGLQVSPEEATGDASLVPHEVTTEKEGVGADGIPVKQKIAMVGKGLR
jgi:hypothetical protein